MKQQQFEQQRLASWREFTEVLDELDLYYKRNRASIPEDFAAQFRHISNDLALARDRMYSIELINYLNDMAARAHKYMYQKRGYFIRPLVHLVQYQIPRLFRTEWSLSVITLLLFFVPLIATAMVVHNSPEYIYSLMSDKQVNGMAENYSASAEKLGRGEGSSADINMFGVYVWNNISIDFRCFAAGILFGVGTLFFVLFNGLLIGAVIGYLGQLSPTHAENLYSFIAGHSAFELTGLILSAMAGLMLGRALLTPGNFTRGTALARATRAAMPLLYAAFMFTLLAAFIEAFWSARIDVSANTKYWVGGILWATTPLYFLFTGRGRYGS